MNKPKTRQHRAQDYCNVEDTKMNTAIPPEQKRSALGYLALQLRQQYPTLEPRELKPKLAQMAEMLGIESALESDESEPELVSVLAR